MSVYCGSLMCRRLVATMYSASDTFKGSKTVQFAVEPSQVGAVTIHDQS